MELRDVVSGPAVRARPHRWAAGVLFALIVLLFALSYTRNRAAPSRQQGSVANLALDNLLVARQLYVVLHSTVHQPDTLERLKLRLAAGQEEAALADPSPPSIRRLALSYYMIGDPRWRAALLRLRTAPAPGSTSSILRELALWNNVLDGVPNRLQVMDFRRAVATMDLGWYSHIALEAAYRRAGLTTEADEEVHEANRSSARLVLLSLVAMMAGMIGVGIWAYLGARFTAARRQYRPPLTFVDRLLTPCAPWPLTDSQRGVLYYIFLSYLASMALLRIALAWLGLGPALTSASRVGPFSAILISIGVSLLPVAVPAFLYVRFARPAFIDRRALGFCTSSWRIDILCGVAGYMAAVPLVYVAKVLSETLFKGIETPVNPAISAFAGSGSALLQALIFAQAALLAPVVEETLFRGIFFQANEHRHGVWGSALLASAVFALLHPQLPLGFLGIFVLGMIFNMLFTLRRSLLPSIVAHAINNAIILLFLLTLVRG